MRTRIGFLMIAVASMMGDNEVLALPLILIVAGAMLIFAGKETDV